MTKLVNLTPHLLRVQAGDVVVEVPPSGTVARVDTRAVGVGVVDLGNGLVVPAVATSFGDVTGLPAPTPGVLYLVSAVVLDRVPDDRTDVAAPDTGPSAVRDDKGQVFAVVNLRFPSR